MHVVSGGLPEPLGVTLRGDGVNIAVWSQHATAIDICFFDGDTQTARLSLPERTGNVFHGHVHAVKTGQRYGLRAHGPYDPASGHRFNPQKLLVDPHAQLLDQPFALHPSQQGFANGAPERPDLADSAAFVPKALVIAAQLAVSDTRPRHAFARMVIGEVHVRSFTLEHPDVPQALRGTFAGLAHPAVVAHFAKLGVTTIELMPAVAWIDERHLPPLGLHNVWGYNPIAFGPPDPRLAPGGWSEIRACIGAYHHAGIEVVLDVVFNHTGESDALGPTLCLRGLDNAAYYALPPNDPAAYVNDTGCGNTLALGRPQVVRMVMDSLRLWARAGIDGFRFDLATTLGRSASGFDASAPLITAILQDPVLADVKLIAEPWDIGPGGYQLGQFPAAFAEWNDRFRDDARRFWRGDDAMAGALATRLAGSADTFSAKRRPSRGINFIAAHDGLTLLDLVSFTQKHNLANGESNRDGTSDNHSWNFGIEGPTDDAAIRAQRSRAQRNLLATLLLARGTPMLAMGSELGHSQRGNNNAYAVDFPIDWSRADVALMTLASKLIALRLAHRALHMDMFLTGDAVGPHLPPDARWLAPDATPLTDAAWQNPHFRAFWLCLFVPALGEAPADGVAILINAEAARLEARLPQARPGFAWQQLLDTSERQGQSEGALGIEAHSIMVFAEQPL